jgi:hypothetical protein
MKNVADLIFEGHGTLVLVHPDSQKGRDWLDEHCGEGEARTYFGDALVVEHRYAADLARVATSEGLMVS